METLDIIKQLCNQKNVSISQLEADLGYGNGSIAKSKSMSADRLYKISQYFGVSMEYLLTGKTINETDDEMKVLKKKQDILLDINRVSLEMSELYKKISDCQKNLTSLRDQYMLLEKGEEAPTHEATHNFSELFAIMSKIQEADNEQ
jgi:transcriptional regulator with XRE-family HTH domain